MSLFNYLFGDKKKADARVGGTMPFPPAGPDGGSVNAPQPETDPFVLQNMPPQMMDFAQRLIEESGAEGYSVLDFDSFPRDMREDMFRRFNEANPKGFRRQPGMGI